MRVPLITTRDVGSASLTELFPSTDSQGRIVYTPEDGRPMFRYPADKVSCMDHLTNNTFEKPFEFSEPSPGTWDVVLTKKRITFFNPLSIGVFGKTPKAKSGKVTAGHLGLDSILHLRAGFMSPTSPYLSVGCKRYDKTTSYVLIFASPKVLNDLAGKLHAAITAHVDNAGTWIDDSRFLEKWKNFPAESLFDGNEHMAIVPANMIKLVHNSATAAYTNDRK